MVIVLNCEYVRKKISIRLLSCALSSYVFVLFFFFFFKNRRGAWGRLYWRFYSSDPGGLQKAKQNTVQIKKKGEQQ
jgi:hypothetical protein